MNQNDIIRMARESGLASYEWVPNVGDEDVLQELTRFAALVAAAERERCAQVCEDHFMSDGHWCAQAIRKGEK